MPKCTHCDGSGVEPAESPRLKKRQTRLDDRFLDSITIGYPQHPPGEVLGKVEDARGHANWTKWSDKQRYVLNWLARDWGPLTPVGGDIPADHWREPSIFDHLITRKDRHP